MRGARRGRRRDERVRHGRRQGRRALGLALGAADEPRGLLPGGRPRGRDGAPGAGACCSRRARTSGGSSASSRSARSRSSRSARSSGGCARARQGGVGRSSTPSDDRDRVAAVDRRARGRARARSPARAAGLRVELTGRAARPRPRRRLCRAAKRPPLGVLPLDRALRGRRASAAAGARSSTTSATRRRPRRSGAAATSTTRPTGCRAITVAAGRGATRPRRRRRTARRCADAELDAAEGLAPRARRGQAGLHRGDRRDAARDRAPPPAHPAELLAIKGIGPSFVDKHAESLLELLHG